MKFRSEYDYELNYHRYYINDIEVDEEFYSDIYYLYDNDLLTDEVNIIPISTE